ncbi:MAG: nucleotidyltransferase family protein [Clostridia bacterium]|nr:nucleotidyltransferase family protein [Clostridia bacterium]
MDETRFCAVICEYNPFHRGHLFQLNKIKERFGASVCVMSGDLVQRGDIAVADKYTRARAALECGADLVLELPAPWCCASAADFARAGVSLAARAGASALAFGVRAEPDVLRGIAALVSGDGFASEIKRASGGKNVSFPAALEKAVRARLGEEAADALREPNNILAVEYLKNLRGSGMEPFAVARNAGFGSSGEIRALGDTEKMLALLPENSAKVFAEAFAHGGKREISRLDAHFVAFFRTLRGREPLSGIYGMTSDLAAKFLREAKHSGGFEELCALCVDKKYTLARVRRAAIAAVLGYTAAEVKKDPPFTTLLAANAKGRALLASLRKTGRLTVVTKPADAPANVREEFASSARASALASLAAEIPQACDRGASPTVITR